MFSFSAPPNPFGSRGHANTPSWGLLGCSATGDSWVQIQLFSVTTKVSIRGFVAQVDATLTYINKSSSPIEVEYVLPVDEGAAVYKFEAVIDDRTIIAQCMEKKQAEQVYKDAIESGHTAVLAREDNLTGDILHLALGNLPTGKEAKLKLGMIMELKVQTDGGVTFRLPSVLNPRYSPADVNPHQSTESVAQHSSPGAIQLTVSAPYTMDVSAQVSGGHAISRLVSHTDPINVTISDDTMTAEITQSEGFKSDHDWNFIVYYANPYKTHVLRETSDRSATGIMKDDLIMINFFPEVQLSSYSNKNEVIFVVDRSGSMQGENIQSARATLLLFLKSLPMGCYFNIISFGSTYSPLFPNGSCQYSENTLASACELQQNMDADMGGTEVLRPLQSIYTVPPIPGYARQILLLSDGAVMNVKQVTDLVKRHAHETRLFAVGVGHGASTALIHGVARAGNGRSEMVFQQDKLQHKVMGMMSSMLQESVHGVTVSCEVEPVSRVVLVPKVPPVIFGGQHLILYVRVSPSANVKKVGIKGCIGDKEINLTVDEAHIVRVHDSEMSLHRLAARAQINQWEIDEEEGVADDMITLSVASGVVSRRTALVGVDQDGRPVQDPMSKTEHLRCPFSSEMESSVVTLMPSGISRVCHRSYRSSPRLMKKRSRRRSGSASPPSLVMERSESNLIELKLCVPLRKGVPPPLTSEGRSRSGSASPSSLVMERSESNLVELKLCVPLRKGVPPPLTSEGRSSSGSASPPSLVMEQDECEEAALKRAVECEYLDVCDSDEDAVKSVEKSGDGLMSLVKLQKFDGSWTLPDVSAISSVSLEQLKANSSSKNEMVWATAVALALLEMKFSDKKDEWILLAHKARAFITGSGEDAEEHIKKAHSFLASESK